MAEAIKAAKKAGIDVDDAKKALAGSLETIATNIKDMDNPSEAATAAKNLAEAIATAGLAPKDIGNAAIMCQLVADGTLVPKGNGEFTAKGFPTDEGNRIWLNKEGNFQMDITVEYNNVMLSYLSKFKSDINEAFGQKIITINVKALEESLKDTQKALKKNAFIFYDFTDNPPIMFTQRRSLFSKLESSVLSYDSDNSKWQKTKKSKSASTVPDFIDTTTQQQPNNSQLRITKNSVTNTNNGNNNDTQREELLKFLQGYRPTNDNSSASTTSAANAPTN